MDAILFHPETSMRRALILALGKYGQDELSPGDREPLIDKLLDLYRNDPDAGIHGAAEWTLRQWEQQDEAQGDRCQVERPRTGAIAAGTSTVRDRPSPSIEGPVEFRHGLTPERAGSDFRTRRPIAG